MARQTVEAWIPEEEGSEVLQRISRQSAVEALARPEPMKSDTKTIPRSGGMDIDIIPKGTAYGEDQATMDTITLSVFKFGRAVRLAEEDLDDAPENIIADRQQAWADAYAVAIDNASLAVTANTVGAGVPFRSIYAQVRNNDATTGYTANTNYVSLSAAAMAATGAGAKALAYVKFSDLLGKVETGDFYSESDMVLIAHPAFKAIFRGTMTDNGTPLWVPGSNEVHGQTVQWTVGAKTSPTFTRKPAGNPIAIFGPRSLMRLGKRSGPESVVIDGRDGASALTDETILKMRARRAFNIGYPEAFAVLELVA